MQFMKDRANLIPILQKAQEAEGYLSPQAIAEISQFLDISENDIYSVATFYALFRFTRPGDHIVKVCLGTACHVRGGERILESVERELNIRCGQTTDDFKFSMERVACVGCCALAPVVLVDQDVHSKMTPAKAKEVLARYKTHGEDI
ncbi:MAG: NADP-reducing hydrogenase subunit HndA [Dehalococcoidia bacterium]|nr:NADP-reducing hydrogenase subunit HndA [Chloroflexota bacterium]MBT9159550.1 NADP-reducing hydrogenase subunit HndA [Chloroflexota bacterium]MBT9161817.1 NADP-reducing hydrogenase subunit HndA [Chloroflexota bacterium]